MRKNKNKALEKVVGIAIFSALALVIALVCNVIPPVQGFLSLDVKDAVITIAAFTYGPVSAVCISFISALIELLTFSTTGWYGFVMNFISSTVFSLTATMLYMHRRTLNGALAALFAAVIATTGAMLLLNTFVTPLYLVTKGLALDVAKQSVTDMLPKILLPFNFAKTMLNGAVLMLMYKPVTIAMSGAGLIEKKNLSLSFNKSSAIILAVGGATLVTALVILLVLW
jgi:riboflavin transporter FmnP